MLNIDSNYTFARLEAMLLSPRGVDYYCYRTCDQDELFSVDEFYFDNLCFTKDKTTNDDYFARTKFGICGPVGQLYSFTDDYTDNFIESKAKPGSYEVIKMLIKK